MEKWKENVKALAFKNKLLADEIEQLIVQDAVRDVKTTELENGRKVMTVERDDYVWHLNSRLDPEGAAGLYADRYEIRPFYRYFIFGFSDGLAIRKLLRKCDASNVLVVCEPNKEILAEALRQYDLKELLLDERVWPCVFEGWEALCHVIFKTIEYSYIKLLEFCILPGYDVLYPKECEQFMDEVIDQVRNEVVNKETSRHFGRSIPHNKLFHMRHMIGQRNVGQIRNELQKTGIEGIPAIIISAGPSLDKNIKEVKKAEGKAFIFVVDAALRTVVREGIRPDLVCTIDANAPERFLDTGKKEHFHWSCGCLSNPHAVQTYMDKIFYRDPIEAWWNESVQKEMDFAFPKIESAGCVSAEAFQIALYLGFQTIILIGQDLAFTGGQSHTEGIKGILGDNDAYINDRYLVEVQDAEGNPLTTDFQMSQYKLWFEKKIALLGTRVRVIDATEGGAKIEGAEILTLKEAIAQECRREQDMYERMDKMPPLFDEAQQERLFKKLYELEALKEEFKLHLEKGIRMERELKEKAKTIKPREIAKRLKEVTQQNEIIAKHPFSEWIIMYAGDAELEMKNSILTEEDMGIEDIMERSIRLLQSYQEGMPLFEEDYREMLMETPKGLSALGV